MAELRKDESYAYGKKTSVRAKTRPAEDEEQEGGIAKKTAKTARSVIGGKASKAKSPLGPNLNFAATESYKLLRTNLLFSFTDDKKCHIVGITSSLRGEGKTTTSINTAYMLAETGRHVLVIEADMRLPSVTKQLDIERAPGLSNLLVNQNSFTEVIKKSGIQDNLYVLPAGDIPPNPSELLGSEAMKNTMEVLASKFDFIIVDLPPITAVSDALVVSKIVDGMVMVISKDYSTRSALSESMSQLRNADARILGFVFTRGDLPGSGKFKKYYKYTPYGKISR